MITSVSYSTNLFNQYRTFTNKNIREKDSLTQIKKDFPWVKNPVIISALNELKQVKFDESEMAYMKSLGVDIPFLSGIDAVNFIKNFNLRIDFADTGGDGIHAQYDYEENKIFLNKKYKNTSDSADILALSEAILHESGHAKDNDGSSSIQEELNSLGIGVLAHKFFERKYPNIFNYSNTLIVNDGVNVYAALFFDSDIQKNGLIKRVRQKYGLLPAGDKYHPPSNLAKEIKKYQA